MEYYYILDTVLSPSLILLETIISVLHMETEINEENDVAKALTAIKCCSQCEPKSG